MQTEIKRLFKDAMVYPNWKAWVGGGTLSLFILAYPILASAPAGTTTAGKPEVLGEATINPLGLPLNTPEPEGPTLTGTLSLKNIQSKSYLAFDVNSGQVLAEHDSDQPVAIASLTKLMTALVVYNNTPSFRQIITITPKDEFSVQPVLGLKAGDEVSINDVFYAMLVGSANDAALTLANHTESSTGKNFVQLMNEEAGELHMTNTHFSNPLGFDSEANYSTAKDLSLLVQTLQKYEAFSLTGKDQSYSFTSNKGNLYSVKATNQLTKQTKDLYAIKTGFTDLAQGAMVSEVRENDHAFIIIVLDSTDRENDTLLLRSEILKNYSWAP